MKHQRRTQAQRSAATKAAVLAATVDCLIEQGYAATTATEVARRARVSLGALVHHFPSKADLLTAAVAHVLELRQAEFRKAMANIESGTDRLDAAIDQLWAAESGPAFIAWVELWVAARTDPELAVAVRKMADDFDRSSQEVFRELFPAADYPRAEFLEHGLRFAFSLMDGVALRGLIVQPIDATPVHLLKEIARERLSPPNNAEGGTT